MNPRRLYRSHDHQLAGVAGGMAEYLDIDPTIVRILWILAGLASAGLAIIAYVVFAIVIPRAPYAAAVGAPWAAAPGASAGLGWSSVPPAPPAWDTRWAAAPQQPVASPSGRARGAGIGTIIGVVLIVFGALALMDVAIPGWVARPLIGPAVILALGAALLVASLRRRDGEPVPPAVMAPEAAGVAHEAAGVAPATGTDPAPPTADQATAEPWDTTDTQASDPRVDRA